MAGTPRKSKQGAVLPHPSYAMVEQTVLERNDELRRTYGAHHIGVSKKYRDNERQSETCITFYVKEKSKTPQAEPIPKHIALTSPGGARRALIATDVCAIGTEEPQGFRMRGGNLVVASDGETGTVGLVFRRGGRDFFLTNAHVITDPGIVVPGPVTVHDPDGMPVQGVVRQMDKLHAPLIRSDAALVEVPPGIVSPKQFRGTDLVLDSCGEIANNDPRQFFYVAGDKTPVLRWRAFVPAATQIRIDGHLLNYAGFHKLAVVSEERCGPGDSGAVVFCRTQGGLKAVGLLFGGIVATNEVWVFPVRLSLAQMGIDPDSL
jgi:hypothetical protein